MDACVVYKWVEKGAAPESLVGYSFIIKGKVDMEKNLVFLE